jgi:Ca2+/Na+ antiporter
MGGYPDLYNHLFGSSLPITNMNNVTPTTSESRTPTEAAGYIGGALTAIALLVASIVALILAFQTESVLSIARIAFVYMVVVAVLIGSAVFQQK